MTARPSECYEIPEGYGSIIRTQCPATWPACQRIAARDGRMTGLGTRATIRGPNADGGGTRPDRADVSERCFPTLDLVVRRLTHRSVLTARARAPLMFRRAGRVARCSVLVGARSSLALQPRRDLSTAVRETAAPNSIQTDPTSRGSKSKTDVVLCSFLQTVLIRVLNMYCR